MTIFCHQSPNPPSSVSEAGTSHPPGSVLGRMWCSFGQCTTVAGTPQGQPGRVTPAGATPHPGKQPLVWRHWGQPQHWVPSLGTG